MIRGLIIIGLVAGIAKTIQISIPQSTPSLKPFEDICKDYGVQCTVKILKHQGHQAYTNADKTIFISQGILKDFTPDEVRAIFFHEMAHLFYGHPDVAMKYYTGELRLSKEGFNSLRRAQEFAADATATHLLLLHGYPSALGEALIRISNGQATQASDTHPAVIDRIEQIRQIENQYCK